MLQAPRERIGSALMSRAARLVRTKRDERLALLGLTQANGLILLYLSRYGARMPQKDIAEAREPVRRPASPWPQWSS